MDMKKLSQAVVHSFQPQPQFQPLPNYVPPYSLRKPQTVDGLCLTSSGAVNFPEGFLKEGMCIHYEFNGQYLRRKKETVLYIDEENAQRNGVYIVDEDGTYYRPSPFTHSGGSCDKVIGRGSPHSARSK